MSAATQRTRSHPTRRPAAAPARTPAATRLLLVEDDPLTAQIFERSLARAGYVTEVARDGLQAERRIAERAPCAVVLDMNLPVGSGADVVRTLRARGGDIPVLIVSGKQPWQTALTPQDLAPGRWLTKPVKPRDLIDAVQAMLADR